MMKDWKTMIKCNRQTVREKKGKEKDKRNEKNKHILIKKKNNFLLTRWKSEKL